MGNPLGDTYLFSRVMGDGGNAHRSEAVRVAWRTLARMPRSRTASVLVRGWGQRGLTSATGSRPKLGRGLRFWWVFALLAKEEPDAEDAKEDWNGIGRTVLGVNNALQTFLGGLGALARKPPLAKTQRTQRMQDHITVFESNG